MGQLLKGNCKNSLWNWKGINACVLHKFGCLSEIQMPNKNICPILSITSIGCTCKARVAPVVRKLI